MENTVGSSKPESDASRLCEPPAKRTRLPDPEHEEGQTEKAEGASEAQQP